MQRVIIMGGPGSGKSTLARELGSVLGLPVYHLDRYFWKPGWVQATLDEFSAHVRDLAGRDRWVIDGNYSKTLADRLARADTVVYLDMPLRVRLPRVLMRSIRHHGRIRQDLGEGCPERIDLGFLRFVVNYQRDRHIKAIDELSSLHGSGIRLFHLRSSAEVRSFLEHASQQVTEQPQGLAR